MDGGDFGEQPVLWRKPSWKFRGSAGAASATRLDFCSALAIVGIPWPALGPGAEVALPLGSG